MPDVLPQAFYARDSLVVAEALLGKLLCRDGVTLRISEVEAYCYPDDTASHCRMGRTPRNSPMWGPPGHAYVYLCYGMHQMLNVVTNAPGEGAAVLIRSCEPVSGHALIKARRGGIEGPAALTGPRQGRRRVGAGRDLLRTAAVWHAWSARARRARAACDLGRAAGRHRLRERATSAGAVALRHR